MLGSRIKKKEWGGGVMNWEIGIDIYTLICIKWITTKNLLYKKINKKKFKKKSRKKKQERRMKRIDSLRDLWDKIKCTNI